MHEVVMRIKQPSVPAEATAGTETAVELWCNDHCDLLHLSGPDGEAVLERIERLVGVQELLVEGDERVAMTEACLKEHEADTVESFLARHNCLLVPPLRYVAGEKWCRILALDSANLTALYRDLVTTFPVTIESKREIRAVSGDRPLLTPETALPDLSSRQQEALVLAVEMGYYRIPRETTTSEIAAEMGVERRTMEEHLRRAENKIVGGMVSFYGGRGNV
ncbi:transcriptional regulator [Haladaptatus sp. W1]|uniref:helix-turn-helix domain-containing protein n=1 Tax=Haladaptatus sp. W1 TaxID=1897478 RepID=UPI000849BDB7|nr:helix-turn-helix domain-containing protein [Haladaptatus sp. W1]ODR83095.1 transcriptional regulator [Haladaptatus sp. W1]